MPYFPELNILFIHIPKTGGTSIEKYFENKSNIKMSHKNLYSSNNEILYNHTLQHLTYNEIYNIKNILHIDFNNVNIITVVRNPYERIISELFFHNMINKNSSKDEVSIKLYEYINSKNTYDNHKPPQYIFLIDNNYKINNKIIILKTETLNYDMKKLGFTDFNFNEQKNKNSNVNYYYYLNNYSINLINNYYDKDFYIFSYNKINIFENNNYIKNNLNNVISEEDYYIIYEINKKKNLIYIFFFVLFVLFVLFVYYLY
jgi:hypothetical protein